MSKNIAFEVYKKTGERGEGDLYAYARLCPDGTPCKRALTGTGCRIFETTDSSYVVECGIGASDRLQRPLRVLKMPRQFVTHLPEKICK